MKAQGKKLNYFRIIAYFEFYLLITFFDIASQLAVLISADTSSTKLPEFESLSEMMSRVNELLQNKPINGKFCFTWFFIKHR